jgi:thiol-disulfide isomerase/thioredoxin
MKSSALIAVVLSGAAIVGYVSYRAWWPAPQDAPIADTGAGPPPGAAPAATLPEFSLMTLEGEQRSIHSWPDRALVINFWATWCAPCLREIPLLKSFQSAHEQDGVQVIGIAVDRVEPVRSFAADLEFNYPTLIGEADAIEAAASFGIDFFALPFTVFTDAEGNVLGVHTGELEAADLDELARILAGLDDGGIDLPTARDRLAGRR